MSPLRAILRDAGQSGSGDRWWRRRGALGVAIWMFLVSGICLGAVVVAAHNTRDLIRLSHQNHRLALRANRLGMEIQGQRRRSLVADCQASNRKYKASVHRLTVIKDLEINGDPKHGIQSTPAQVVTLFEGAGITITNPQAIYKVEKASIQASYIQTVLLISSIVPHNADCQQLADKKAPPAAAAGKTAGVKLQAPL